MDYKNHIREQLTFLYGEKSQDVWRDLSDSLDKFRERTGGIQSERFDLSEKDVVLITYGDQFQSPDQSHLKTLADFLKNELGSAINRVHLLPFYPYSSDDGFSVIDYRQVDPEIGTWMDIQQLAENYDLMFDAVINHISRHSEWFQAYKNGIPPYSEYFIEIDPSTDLSSIFRPRALPLLHAVETAKGEKHLWTTFSEDQIDLDFSNPSVLLEIIDLLLFYVEKGARLIRLDAIGYVWKLVGTSSLNLPQAHSIVKITRAVLNIAAPQTGIITETNVPHEENMKYFGDPVNCHDSKPKPCAGDEAQMIYQFSLAPLVLHTIYNQDVTALTDWINTLQVPFQDAAFFNFIASHDGIGVMPAKGLLTDADIQNLVDKTILHGGDASYKTNSDGTQSVYELNITLFDGLNNPADRDQELSLNRFLASQAIMLSLAGVPGIYVHSLFGSHNCHACREESGRARSLNREKFDLHQLQAEIHDPDNIHARVFQEYKHLLLIRKENKVFHPSAPQKVIKLQNQVFALMRYSLDNMEQVLCLINISPEAQLIDIELSNLDWQGALSLEDFISGERFITRDTRVQFTMTAYQTLWLSPQF